MKTANESYPDHWFVTDGVVADGPLSFELLTRRVAEGRLPDWALVRHASWHVWRRLAELGSLEKPLRSETVRSLAEISRTVDERANSRLSIPPPPPSSEELSQPTDSRPVSRTTLRPIAVDPVGVLSSADDLGSALLLTLSTSVTAASAEVGLLHRYRMSLGAAVTTGAHGPNAEQLLGERLDTADPALAAALAGHTVVTEPHPGETGRFILGRISRCIRAPRGAAMVPLTLYDQLVAVFEIGRSSAPLRAREVARVEDVVEALAERIVVMGWMDLPE